MLRKPFAILILKPLKNSYWSWKGPRKGQLKWLEKQEVSLFEGRWKDFLLFCLERQVWVGDRVKNYTLLKDMEQWTPNYSSNLISGSWRLKELNLEASPLCIPDRNMKWEWWVYETCYPQAVLWAIYTDSNMIEIISWWQIYNLCRNTNTQATSGKAVLTSSNPVLQPLSKRDCRPIWHLGMLPEG